MFRKSTILAIAFLGLAAGQEFTAMTKNHTKTNTGKVPKTKTPHSKKVENPKNIDGFTLCTGTYGAYIGGPNIAGTGAFSYPVYPGACEEVLQEEDVPDPVGDFSGTCSGNPWEGISFSYYRITDTTGQSGDRIIDSVGPCTTVNGCDYTPTMPPQFKMYPDFNTTVPPNMNASALQSYVNAFCQNAFNANNEMLKSHCSAELRIKPAASKSNKYPGSVLTFSYGTVTTFEFKGATYTTDTQYALGGAAFGNGTVGDGDTGALYQVDLYSAPVIDTATCVWAPKAIDTSPAIIYGGSGKYEKYATKYVETVEQDTVLLNHFEGVGNPLNLYQSTPLVWGTELNVVYQGKRGYLDWPLL